jgi:hypothetical protein
MSRIKKIKPLLQYDPKQLIIGTANANGRNTDPDNIYHADTGLDLSTKDYDPGFPMRGFMVSGLQNNVAVDVMFSNGSTITYGNINITAELKNTPACIFVKDILIKKILKTSTAAGIHPIF